MEKENLELLAHMLELRQILPEYSKEITELRKEIVKLRLDRDLAIAKVNSLLPRVTLEEEAQLIRDLESGMPFSHFLCELDAKFGKLD
jgi:hypothetical protein